MDQIFAHSPCSLPEQKADHSSVYGVHIAGREIIIQRPRKSHRATRAHNSVASSCHAHHAHRGIRIQNTGRCSFDRAQVRHMAPKLNSLSSVRKRCTRPMKRGRFHSWHHSDTEAISRGKRGIQTEFRRPFQTEFPKARNCRCYQRWSVYLPFPLSEKPAAKRPCAIKGRKPRTKGRKTKVRITV